MGNRKQPRAEKFVAELGTETAKKFLNELKAIHERSLENHDTRTAKNGVVILGVKSYNESFDLRYKYNTPAVNSFVRGGAIEQTLRHIANCLKAISFIEVAQEREALRLKKTEELITQIAHSAKANSEVLPLPVDADVQAGVSFEANNSPQFIPIPFATQQQAREAIKAKAPMIPFNGGVLASVGEELAIFITKKQYRQAHDQARTDRGTPRA